MSAPFIAGTALDDYEIVGVLGQGGMSTVYRARDRRDGTDVVLKVPYDHLLGDPAVFERFQRELKIGRTLAHPHIQKSLATGTYRDQPYMVMEYVDGVLLRDVLRERMALPIAEAIGITVQLCSALAYCHAQGIYHRDLKPENILITPDGQAKLMDFGIALMEGARRVTWRGFSAIMGTPDYMAPEQIKGKRGDAATDIYAVGVMLYEMLAGEVPYRGDNPLAIMSQHVNAPPPRLRARNHDVSEVLDRVIAKAMHRDPVARYGSAEAFAHDLTHLEGVDLSTLPALDEAQPSARTKQWSEVLRLVILILVVIALLLLIGVLAQSLHH
jgi:serine/threonine-protein kinase